MPVDRRLGIGGGLNGDEGGYLCERVKVTIGVQHGDFMGDGDCGDEAVHVAADRESCCSPRAVEARRGGTPPARMCQ